MRRKSVLLGGLLVVSPLLAVAPARADTTTSSVEFASASFSAAEGDRVLTITVARTGDLSRGATVRLDTVHGTAGGLDYLGVHADLELPAGAAGVSASVLLAEDDVVEGDEAFGLALSAPSLGVALGGRTTATGVIVDDDVTPLLYGLTSADAVVPISPVSGVVGPAVPVVGLPAGSDVVALDTRPADGRVAVVVRGTDVDSVRFVDPVTGATTVVADLATRLVGGSFDADVEPYSDSLRIVSDAGQNLRLRFADGAQFADGQLTLGGAGEAPADVRGLAYTGSTPGSSSGVAFAIDTGRDVLARLAPPDSGSLAPLAALGVDASGEVGFDITDTAGAYASLTVDGTTGLYSVSLASPSAGQPTVPAAAARLGSFALPGVEDITVSVPGFAITPVGSGRVSEGSNAQVTVTRLGDDTRPASVEVSTTDGTAIAGADYVAGRGTLAFAAGQRSVVLTIPTRVDTLTEGPETLTVDLSRPSKGQLLSDSQAVITLLDPAAGALSVPAGPRLVDEGAGTVTIPVTRSSTQGTASARVTTLNGAATGGRDYAVLSGTVAFAAGQRTALVTVRLLDDQLVEPRESFAVLLTAPSAGAVIAQPRAVITLLSNDARRITSLTLTGSSTVARTVTLTGVLRDRSGSPLAGRSVRLRVARPTGPTQALATARTTASGRFTVVSRAQVPGSRYAAIFDGSSQEAASSSQTITPAPRD